MGDDGGADGSPSCQAALNRAPRSTATPACLPRAFATFSGSGRPEATAGPPGFGWKSEVFHAVGSAASLTKSGFSSRVPRRSRPLASRSETFTCSLLVNSERVSALTDSFNLSGPQFHITVVFGTSGCAGAR